MDLIGNLEKNTGKALELIVHSIKLGGQPYEQRYWDFGGAPFYKEGDMFLVLSKEDYKRLGISEKEFMEGLRILVEKEKVFEINKLAPVKLSDEVLTAKHESRTELFWLSGSYLFVFDKKTQKNILEFWMKTNGFDLLKNKSLSYEVKEEGGGYYFCIKNHKPLFFGNSERAEIKVLKKFRNLEARFSRAELNFAGERYKTSFNNLRNRINHGINKNNKGLESIGFKLESFKSGSKNTVYGIIKKEH